MELDVDIAPAGGDQVSDFSVVDGNTGEPLGGAGTESSMSDVIAGAATDAGRQTADPAAQTAAQPGQQTAQPALEAPIHWGADERAGFAKLAPEMQKFLLDQHKGMEASFTRKQQEFAPLNQVQQRWDSHLKSTGGQLAQVADTAMQFDYAMRSAASNDQRLDVLFKMGRMYGVDFSQAGGPQQIDPKDDPFAVQRRIQEAHGPLEQQIGQVNQTLAQMQQQAEQQKEQQKQAEIAQMKQTVAAFQNERDDKGQIKHPYFADVQQDIVMLAKAMQASGQPMDLAKLYEQACWTNPNVRAKMQQRVSAPGSSAQAAAGAYGGVVGAAGGLTGAGGAGRPADESTEDFMRSLWPA